MRTWMAYACALLALGLIMWRLSLDLKLTLALLGGGLVATLVLGALLLLGLNGLRRALARAACHGGWDSASCCGTRWPPPDRAWPSA